MILNLDWIQWELSLIIRKFLRFCKLSFLFDPDRESSEDIWFGQHKSFTDWKIRIYWKESIVYDLSRIAEFTSPSSQFLAPLTLQMILRLYTVLFRIPVDIDRPFGRFRWTESPFVFKNSTEVVRILAPKASCSLFRSTDANGVRTGKGKLQTPSSRIDSYRVSIRTWHKMMSRKYSICDLVPKLKSQKLFYIGLSKRFQQ